MTFSLGGRRPFLLRRVATDAGASPTTSDGAVAFANVPPGEHTITAAGAASCVTRASGSIGGVDRTGFRVEAGALTFVRLVDCAPR
ncbi:MAG: hypothetical protein R3B99_07040 [Polyangiales bacterium]